jgi:hypothetical protein
MRILKILCVLSSLFCSISAEKTVYIPRFITNAGMNLNSTSSQWCYARSKESENVVVFWESGFGSDPSTASGSYKVTLTTLLQVAEKAYVFYRDSLKFAIKGSSVTDKHKLMIFLLYQTTWAAYGSGQDDKVGSLHVNPAAANSNTVVAHEIGHCFQYISGCDGDGGYQYGLGDNGAGGNGFWEQCAQWMAFKVYPQSQFTAGDFRNYISSNHLHILHETPRYANYFLPDYWTYKRGLDFTGRLWRESRRPEDPVETYKRLTSITQVQFNDEIYEHAVRLTTWDLPAIQSYGANYIDSRAQVKMTSASGGFWQVDSSVCIENYGYNSIKLIAPTQATTVSVKFQGIIGTSGFRSVNPTRGGWRYGFVALCKDGARVYSAMGAAHYANNTNPDQSLSFDCPANCSKLWLVVSGAPQEHWHHAWDDNNSNDEHWPYQVRFGNTNLLGQPVVETEYLVATNRLNYNRPLINSHVITLPVSVHWQITNLSGKRIGSGFGNSIDIKAFSCGGYILSCAGMSYRFFKSPATHAKL